MWVELSVLRVFGDRRHGPNYFLNDFPTVRCTYNVVCFFQPTATDELKGIRTHVRQASRPKTPIQDPDPDQASIYCSGSNDAPTEWEMVTRVAKAQINLCLFRTPSCVWSDNRHNKVFNTLWGSMGTGSWLSAHRCEYNMQHSRTVWDGMATEPS